MFFAQRGGGTALGMVGGDKHLKEAMFGANHSLWLCGDTMSDWSSKNPYMTQITENYVLNGKGSRKETRHIVFELGDSGLDYKVGDALGVLAENPPCHQ